MNIHFDRLTEIYLTRQEIEAVHHHGLTPAGAVLVAALRKKGETALAARPVSVMEKNLTPSSGDKHDFLRMPTYAWPNPDTANGLPYIIRDGLAGPGVNSDDYDMGRLQQMTGAVIALAWAAVATGEETFADHAVKLLHTWFLDHATRMNPNLTYGKWTPGDEPPYPTGVIATHRWVDLVQACGILAGTPAWSAAIADGLRNWFSDYLEWLLTSDQGMMERDLQNNRGTWYDAQVVAFARFIGNDDLAGETLHRNCPRRLDEQIAPDGTLPHELRRTNSFGYTLMTLRGWAVLALMGNLLGIDLWRWRHPDGRSLRWAFDQTGHYIGRPDAWPHQQIKPVRFDSVVFTYRAAARAYADESLLEPLKRLDEETRQTSVATALFAP